MRRGVLRVASEEDRLARVVAFDEGGWRWNFWERQSVSPRLDIRVVDVGSVVPRVRSLVLVVVPRDAVIVSVATQSMAEI